MYIKGGLYMPNTILSEWGNSLGIRIPKSILKKANISQGDQITFDFLDGKIIITPTKKKTLKSLLSKITDENLHEEVNWGIVDGEKW
jgi:antitoxin MazE